MANSPDPLGFAYRKRENRNVWRPPIRGGRPHLLFSIGHGGGSCHAHEERGEQEAYLELIHGV